MKLYRLLESFVRGARGAFYRHKIGSNGRRSRGPNPISHHFCLKAKKEGSFFNEPLVAEMGFEPHDLRVMSPTSYQTAPLRDMMVPEAGIEPVREVNLTGF